jgi:hypothetical protein
VRIHVFMGRRVTMNESFNDEKNLQKYVSGLAKKGVIETQHDFLRD